MALPSKDKVLRNLLTRGAHFQHVFKVDAFFWVADRIDSLTALCSPTLRRRDGQARIDYDRLLVVVDDLDEPIIALKSAIELNRFVGLPKVYDPTYTLETFVVDDALTPWLIEEMRSDMDQLTIDRDSALKVIRCRENKFVESLQRVFQDRFVKDIVQPLERLR